MAGAELAIVRRVRALLGSDIPIETGDGRVPLITPRHEDQIALLLDAASTEGWRVRVHGAGSWIPRDAPADLALSLAGLSDTPLLDSGDLVTVAQAGVRWSTLRQRSADGGAWVALDPPGGDRTVGSIVATATAGPLRSGFGNVRDHVLGLTMITGDGRRLEFGGRVVKNVAGFDVAKLATGAYGTFGVITAVTLRLRALPRADVSLVLAGPRDALLDAARAISAAGLSPAAMELASPDAAESVSWKLGIRLLGGDQRVIAERDEVAGLTHQAAGIPVVETDTSLWTTLLTGHAR
ncbi:MAG: FAD-binding oxidoreductase, partial [Gemmatimonadales bacterium]